MMGVSTARDALTAELLGDVGKMHDEVKAMPEKIEKVSARLEELTGGFAKAAEYYRHEIDSFIKASAELNAKSCVRDVQEQVRTIVDRAIKESLGNDLAQTISNIKSVTNEAQNSIKTNENLVREVVNSKVGTTALWCLISGTIGGMLAGFFLVWFFK